MITQILNYLRKNPGVRVSVDTVHEAVDDAIDRRRIHTEICRLRDICTSIKRCGYGEYVYDEKGEFRDHSSFRTLLKDLAKEEGRFVTVEDVMKITGRSRASVYNGMTNIRKRGMTLNMVSCIDLSEFIDGEES